MNPNMAIVPRRSHSYNHKPQGQGSSSAFFDRPVPRPTPPRSQSQISADKRLPALPPRDEISNNPFVSEDDFAPASGFLQPKRESPQVRPRGKTMDEGWNTFTNPYGNNQGERAGDGQKGVWGTGQKGKEPNSPSSSRGTRDSAQTSSEENPFK